MGKLADLGYLYLGNQDCAVSASINQSANYAKNLELHREKNRTVSGLAVHLYKFVFEDRKGYVNFIKLFSGIYT